MSHPTASPPPTALTRVTVDGSPAAAAALAEALRSALAGGPAVLPTAGDAPVPVTAGDLPPGTAVVIATTGSTGEAKLVALSAAALRASARATSARIGGPARWLLALPAEHIAGVQVIVRALLAGASPQVLDLRSGFRPDDLATATSAMGPGRRYTSLVPTQLGRVLDGGGPGLDALRSYAAVLVGGAALEPTLHQRAREAGVAVVTTYGMTETAGGCVYDGVPLDGVVVELDADGAILLGGPMLAAGYLAAGHLAVPDRVAGADPAAGADRAAAAAAFAGGRFRTGDLGRWHDGRLEVLGRADDVIITGGEKVAPAAVERVLVAQPGVAAACVVGLPDPEWGRLVVAVIVADGPRSGDPDARYTAVRAAVRAALGRAAVPRRIIEVPAIPLRGIGKPDRQAVARLAAEAGTGPDTVTDGQHGPRPSE